MSETEKSQLLQAMDTLLPEISLRSEETERNRMVAPDIMERLRKAGLFRMMIPRSFGGEELSLMQAVRVIEALARADGSAGWNAMVIFGFNTALGRLPEKAVNTLLSSCPDVLIRGALAPLGKAVPCDGGYRISGTWPFASGSYMPEWVVATAIVHEGNKPKIAENGMPLIKMALLPVSSAEFLDTWYSVGLCGSSSHDFRISDEFVAEEWTTNLFDLTLPSAFKTPLLQMPFRALAGPTHSAVAIGIAQGAIDDLTELSCKKRGAFNQALLADDTIFRHKLGELSVRLTTLRAAMDYQVRRIETFVREGIELAPMDYSWGSGLVSHTHTQCVDIVNEVFALAGSVPVYKTSSIQRRWRDVRCAAQHVGASPSAFQAYGALLVEHAKDSGGEKQARAVG